jgi:hypothetical protein
MRYVPLIKTSPFDPCVEAILPNGVVEFGRTKDLSREDDKWYLDSATLEATRL